jgi:TolB-like protein/Tfp pilus assembly protein PilF
MIGKTLNHFKILDRLGKGGMGEVYVAEDGKLKRKVALKVLPEEVAGDPARLDRFQREAESIAALNHPNIVTIYSIEEADEIHFLTMELVEGETLTQLIPSNGIDVESFLRFSVPVAEALSAAHEKGIIHRDLKPGNIMFSNEGRIKVLDFGLAKLIRNDSDPDSSRMETHAQTEDGIVLGTMPYMSPEQIQGKRLDQRSDIFSLGIIFYEMIAGCRPFYGDTSAELISSIMRDTPAPVGDLKEGVPEHLERIIRRCLMKDPRDRYQTARDVYNELRDFNSTSGSSKRPAFRSTSGEMWIAVLPLQYPAADPEMESFADGLAQDITAALSQFSYLSVIAQDSTERLKARYVLQGGIRKSGSLIRVNIQLRDTHGGANLWVEIYNRDLQNSDIFKVQDEITDRVAATVADNFGVLVRSMVATLEGKPEDQLSANEFVLLFFGYFAKLTPEEHTKMRATLENAVQKYPRNAELWACLSTVYANENYLGLNPLPNSLDRCLIAAQRAVELNRASQSAHEALAWAHFLRRDLAAVPAAIDRAISLNPRNSNTLATLGGLLVHTREFERGAKMTRRAMELNPHHAGWYQCPLIWDHCSRGEWEQMVDRAKRINMPGFLWVPLTIASACGHLNRKSEAASAVKELLAIDPEFGAHARDYMAPLLSASGLIDSLMDGLQKAGLQIPHSGIDAGSQPENITASELRDSNASSGSFTRPVSAEMWIAVLPFQHQAADPEIENFAEGLAEDITAALSQFSYLSVSGRKAGEQMGARYVIQGGIRKSGSLIRANVQVIDNQTGTNLWAETYNRDLKSSDIFTIQDEITDRVAATLADHFGVLVRSMVASLEDKPDDQLSANEFVFRFFGYWAKLTPEEHAKIRTTLERAVERIPRNADIWACLSLVYYHEFAFGFNELPNSLDRCMAAAQRAVELNRISQHAYEALTWAQFFRRDVGALPATVERAISLNPRSSHMLAVAGLVLVHTRNFDRGATVARRAMELNPHHAGWYHFSLIWDHYSRGEYDQALERAKRVNMPGFFWPPLVIASVCGHLGRKAEAASAVNELLAIDPEFAVHARRYIEPWHYASGFLEPLLEGLRKAGLEVSTMETRNSIAVLPFTNLSADPENEYFCDGLAEEMLNALAKIDQLKVAARTSTFSFKGKSAPIIEIAKALNVNTILEGSVRKSGNRMRITAQLINAADGYHLWSERYDREMKEIFDVQDEITLAVVETLKVKLLGQEQAALLKRHTRNPEAHEFYLRGLAYFIRWTPEFFQKAIQSFNQAIAIDPRYAAAYAALAEAYTEMSFFSPPGEWMPKAKEAARQALELDDTLSNAHNSVAVIKMYYDREYAEAEQEFKRAITLDPGSAHIHMWYGWYLALMGRFEESLKEQRRAQELDPLSDLCGFGIGANFHWSRQPDRAIEQHRRVLELNPNLSIAYWFLAEAYVEKGDFASAIATIENATKAAKHPVMLSAAGYVYAKAGERQKALEILSDLQSLSGQEFEPAFHIAQIYLGLGDNEQAFAWLQKACDERSVWLIWLGVDPKFDPLRSDPRFEELRKKIRFSH